MRLLQLGVDGELTITKDLIHDIPPYAILSHTWGADDDEVTWQEIRENVGKEKLGYQKILFCGEQAKLDGLKYFWVDTCCIDKTNAVELAEAINSMFRWYQNAQICYVYLADVPHVLHSDIETMDTARSTWKLAFRNSKWFTRGWTLQELIAPAVVVFFSSDRQRLGDKSTLGRTIHEATHIPMRAFCGTSFSHFSMEERISWSRSRTTSKREDKAYSLLGLLSISMPIIYGEGEQEAFERLRAEISRRSPLRVLTRLPVADGATFDSHADEHNSQCHPDTRTEVLRGIVEWARDPFSKTVYWLNGMAGTGKSTISRTLAHTFSENGALGATFFFKRGEGDRGGTLKFFTTIASQLIRRVPETARYVQAAMDADPDVISKALREQFNKLIIDPVLKTLSRTPASYSCLIIIVDALDECEREEDVKVLIKLFSGAKTLENLQLKFFLTSRPELPIRLGFKAVDGRYQDFILHEVAKLEIEHDIAVYFKHELRLIQQEFDKSNSIDRQLSANWPTKTDLQTLVQMATPLFIFAATVCRFISDSRVGSPDEQLKEVLKYQSKSQESQLDATYLPVLNQMVANLDPRSLVRVLERFHKVVGSIISLASPLSISALAQLLDIPVAIIDDALRTLHSVLSVPTSPQQSVRPLHLSFRDFLVDPARRNELFWVNEKDIHHQLATQCLRMLKRLEADICKVRAPGTFVSSISSREINARLPSEIQYACRFWTYHLQASEINNSDTNNVWDFLLSHFLHWLEALSWMGRLPESLRMVKDLQLLFPPAVSPKISEFLDDSVRFILATSSSIQVAPLQAYSSALIFSPYQSIIRGFYNQEIADWIALKPKVPLKWGQNLQTLEGHTDWVNSVAFSPDGKLVASASDDGTVILWTADTGERHQTLEGHTGWVSSVAFSPDNKIVASASSDRTVMLWDANTGERQYKLEGHTDWVNSVACSPDGRLVASASNDETVILWTADTGERHQTLKGHIGWVSSVTFSPDGKLVASASHDEMVILWAADTGERHRTFKGHASRVGSVAFSPNGKLVASASYNETVILWAADTGEQQQTLKGYKDEFNSVSFFPDGRLTLTASVVFSPDGKLVASVRDFQTVILWAVNTGEPQQILKGHMGSVSSIAFSSDGKLVASASAASSLDMTVIIWATDTGKQQQTLEGHTGSVKLIAFSPDGKLVASAASNDKTVILWAADTGEQQQTLEGHIGQVSSIMFSPNGKLVASVASGEETVILWATDTGERHQTLEGHTRWVSSVTFSSDSQLVASASIDKTVMIWDADTGEHQQTLEGHTGPVSSTAFSPDGKLVVSASDDETVIIWAIDTGEQQQTLRGHTNSVTSVAFSPDGKLVASASGDKTVILWAAGTGERQQTLEGHTGFVSSIAFSPDGKFVASASDDGTVIIWATDTGERQQTLEGYANWITSTIFIDDKLVASELGIQMVILWATDTGERQQTIHIGTSSYNLDFDIDNKQILAGNNVGYGISDDLCWITFDGKMILRLPPEYRPSRSVIKGSTIVIGCHYGRVLVIRLDQYSKGKMLFEPLH